MTEFEADLVVFRKAPNEANFANVLKQAVTGYQCVEVALAHNVRGSEFAARAFDKAVRGNDIGNYLAISRVREYHGDWRLLFIRGFLMKNLSTVLPKEVPAEI